MSLKHGTLLSLVFACMCLSKALLIRILHELLKNCFCQNLAWVQWNYNIMIESLQAKVWYNLSLLLEWLYILTDAWNTWKMAEQSHKNIILLLRKQLTYRSYNLSLLLLFIGGQLETRQQWEKLFCQMRSWI